MCLLPRASRAALLRSCVSGRLGATLAFGLAFVFVAMRYLAGVWRPPASACGHEPCDGHEPLAPLGTPWALWVCRALVGFGGARCRCTGATALGRSSLCTYIGSAAGSAGGDTYYTHILQHVHAHVHDVA